MRSKRKLLLTAAFTALLGVGAFAGVSSVKEAVKPVEVAEAASTKTVYIDPNILGASNTYVYMKGISGYDTWPGVLLSDVSGYGTVTATHTSRSTTVSFYKFEINTSAEEIDITNSSGSTWYGDKWNITSVKNSAWNLVQLTGWGDGGSYNAHHMHKISLIDDGLTTYEYNPAEWGAYHLPNHSITSVTFDGWYKDGAGDKISDDGEYYMPTNNIDDITFKAKYQSGRYVVGKFGSCNWGLDGARYMTSANSQYQDSTPLVFGNKFKVAYFDGYNFWDETFCGYSSIVGTSNALQYFTADDEDNIVCNARGTYSVSFTDNEYAAGKKVKVEYSGTLNAEHLAAKLMNFVESPGHCGDNDRFPAMRTIYLGLSSAEKTIFEGYASSSTAQFKNAYLRYTAWARALGENPWTNAKANQLIALVGISSGNVSTTIIIIVVTTIAIAAVGGYFLFRKKKEN